MVDADTLLASVDLENTEMLQSTNKYIVSKKKTKKKKKKKMESNERKEERNHIKTSLNISP